MTILAGIFSRDPLVHIPDSACDALRRNISRNPDDRPIEFRDALAFLVKVDIGAFGRPAHRVSPTGSFAMLAGEPLLTCEGPTGQERDAHLAYLQTSLDAGNFEGLRSASGTFCAAYYDPRTNTAQLIADRLGLRPLYYTVVDDFVYFSSALRIFEAVHEIPKKMDVFSVAEITGFGYPFGGGTPYAAIKMVQPCEIVTVRGTNLKSSRYFRWDSISPSHATEEEALKETFEKFRSAVRRRLRGDKTTLAYLSGGLDSRCTVAAIRAEGAHVRTFNFSLANTQDQVFGLEFAKAIGAVHNEVPTEPDPPNWSTIMADALRASPHVETQMPERPNLVWSGEGGSVGLGHVYLSPEIVSLLRQDNLSGAVDVFLRQQDKIIQTRILNPELARQFDGYLHSRLCSELAAIDYPDRLRALYIFLILNGPRRHMEGHFDTVDQHRIEFQMPFNDSEFLEHVTAMAIEPFLYHEFYVKWLAFFDPAVRTVPWQAYPGHVPCPIPIRDNLPDQWNASAASSHVSALESDILERSSAMLSDGRFPHPVLRKSYLRLMWWAWKLKLGNYAYALKIALRYHHYWRMAEGSYELPSPSSRKPRSDRRVVS
jgi:asparagine synthase (glutamine-hydrolysing)